MFRDAEQTKTCFDAVSLQREDRAPASPVRGEGVGVSPAHQQPGDGASDVAVYVVAGRMEVKEGPALRTVFAGEWRRARAGGGGLGRGRCPTARGYPTLTSLVQGDRCYLTALQADFNTVDMTAQTSVQTGAVELALSGDGRFRRSAAGADAAGDEAGVAGAGDPGAGAPGVGAGEAQSGGRQEVSEITRDRRHFRGDST